MDAALKPTGMSVSPGGTAYVCTDVGLVYKQRYIEEEWYYHSLVPDSESMRSIVDLGLGVIVQSPVVVDPMTTAVRWELVEALDNAGLVKIHGMNQVSLTMEGAKIFTRWSLKKLERLEEVRKCASRAGTLPTGLPLSEWTESNLLDMLRVSEDSS